MEFAKEEIKEKHRFMFDQFIKHGFDEDSDVLFYVRNFLGVNLPTETNPACSHHVPPAQFLCDMYFERYDTALAWANRTGGKTKTVAILNHLDAMFKGKIEICTAGAALDQAQKGYLYFVETFDHPFLKPYLVNNIISKSVTRNGTVVQIITGSMKGFNGPHPQKVRIDEVELIDWTVLQEGLSMSVSRGRVRAQDVMTSTRKKSKGTMQRLIEESGQSRTKIYSWCIWDVVERCERQCHDDPTWGNCPIFDKCGGKAHDSNGWYKIDDLVKKASILSKSIFEAQWENKKPHESMTVYGEYWDTDKHAKSWEQLAHIFRDDQEDLMKGHIPPGWKRVAGVDFGSTFVFLLFAIEPRSRTWVLFHEYYCNYDKLLRDHVNMIRKAPSYELLGPIFADSAAKQDRLELRGLGIKTFPAIKDKGSILLGIDEVKGLLQDNHILQRPKLFVVRSECPQTIREFEEWAWETKDDGTPDMEEPVDDDNHCMDSLRYAIYSLPRAGGRYRTTFVEGI